MFTASETNDSNLVAPTDAEKTGPLNGKIAENPEKISAFSATFESAL
jgi:hypothetical protein